MAKSEQGVTQDRYMLIPRTLIFITRGDSVLLLKGSPHKRLWAGKYNGIGGHIEKGEDVLNAARRELWEEAGLAPDDLWLCGTIIIDTGEDVGIVIFVMRGDSSRGEPVASKEGAPEWIPIDAVYALPLVEDLPQLLKRVLPMARGDAPFAAHYTYDEQERLVVTFA